MFLHHPNGQHFEAKAQEEAVRRVLEAQDVALGDLMKSMDRHRYQTKAEMAGVFFLLICSYFFTMDLEAKS